MPSDIQVMERKLRRLERLQNLSLRFHAVSEKMQLDRCPCSTFPHALEKSMQLRGSPRNTTTFAGKLMLSRQITRTIEKANALDLLDRLKVTQDKHTCFVSTQHSVKDPLESTQDASQTLHNLRSFLEEQKKASLMKRQRLQEMKEANAAAERSLVSHKLSSRRGSLSSKFDDMSLITDPSFHENHDSLEGFSIDLDDCVSTIYEETIVFSKTNGMEDAATTITTPMSESSSSFDHESSPRPRNIEEMKSRFKVLEAEKMETAQTLSSFLAGYRIQARSLQMESKRIQDTKETTYSELKTLLVEQSQESEYLQHRVCSLEKRSKKTKWRRALLALLCIALPVGSAIAWKQTSLASQLFPNGVESTWNRLCAPAEPGTLLTPESGAVQAPWWSPSPLQEPLFYMVGCGSRPRLQMKIERGMLRVTNLKNNELLVKKRSETVYVEADKIQVVDRLLGGHMETDLWSWSD